MGMFDTFWGRYTCLKCNHTVNFEEQTKKYYCVLEDFVVGDYVDRGNQNYYYKFASECPFCGEENPIALAIRRGQFVCILPEQEADEIDILSFDNIEDGYARNRLYEQMCARKVGYERENLDRNIDLKLLKPGDTIDALKSEWIVDESYIVRKRSMSALGSLWGDKNVYKVHSEDGKRILCMQKGVPITLYEDQDLSNINDRPDLWEQWFSYHEQLVEEDGYFAIDKMFHISEYERLEKIY